MAFPLQNLTDFKAALGHFMGEADYLATLTSGGLLTKSQAPSGTIVQLVSTQVTGFTTTNGIIPVDTSPPQSSEGSSFGLTVNLMPESTANTIYIRGDFHGSSGSFAQDVWALFLGGSTSAITAGTNEGVAGQMQSFSFLWQATTVSTATTSYTVNLGSNAAATFTLNGQGGAGLFGNTVTSLLTVFEVKD